MIDFHTHILPCVDDGSTSVQQSTIMLKQQRDNNGCNSLVATPHFYLGDDSVDSFIERRDAAYDLLMGSVINGENFPKIIKGAEVLISSDIAELEGLEKLCIGSTKYILLEMPYIYWSEWVYSEIYDIITRRNLIPIIAHIERYSIVSKDPNSLLKLLSMDLVTQMNASSIIDNRTKNFCIKLLKNNMVHILGSDAHNDKNSPPNLRHAYNIIEKKIGIQIIRDIDKRGEDIINNKVVNLPYAKEFKNILGRFI